MSEKLRALVIDDESQTRDLHTLLLTRAGYEVTTISSVTAAQEILANQKFDRIFCDGLNGGFVDVIGAAVLAGIEDSFIYIVSATEAYRERATELGVNFVLKATPEFKKLFNGQ